VEVSPVAAYSALLLAFDMVLSLAEEFAEADMELSAAGRELVAVGKESVAVGKESAAVGKESAAVGMGSTRADKVCNTGAVHNNMAAAFDRAKTRAADRRQSPQSRAAGQVVSSHVLQRSRLW
jgi:hypothetical protein